MKRKKKSPTVTRRRIVDDPVTEYAENVLAGRVVAGPYVRLACQRHINDLARTDELVWKPGDEDTPGTANFVIGFFKKVLRLNGGQFEGLEFELQP